MIDIYYVEDDENIARIVKEYLEQRSCRVSVFHTIAAAQKAFEGHVPAAALVDWNMPDGRGDSLCRWIRSRWKELPLIFLTVRGDSRDIVSGFENGADDYVVKPFELEVLYSRVRALLRRAGNVRAVPFLRFRQAGSEPHDGFLRGRGNHVKPVGISASAAFNPE